MFAALKALLVLGIVSAALAFTEKEICEILPENTSFRHLSSCTKYYTCSDKKPVAATCLDGLFFDKDIGKCSDQRTVKCEANLDEKCTSNSVYLADPESCQNYYLCINGKAKQVSCPSGSNFNPESSSCAQADDYRCNLTTNYNMCDVIAKQTVFRHDTDCKKYRVCADKNIVERSCPASLWFDSVNGRCDTEKKAKCGGPDPVIDPAKPENSDICGTPTRPYTGFVHDGLTCRGYYDCAVKRDVNGNQVLNTSPQHMSCFKNEIFDEKTKKCAPRLQTKCRFDRCNGWGNEYVNVEGDDCRGYAICEKNKEVMRMKCPDKYYFDESQQDCVTTVVNYPSCSKA